MSDFPNATHPAYDAVKDDLALVRDLLGGTREIQRKRAKYLPQYEDETDDEYGRRARAVANVYGGFARVLEAAVGMLFARPAKLSDDAGPIAEHWNDLDRRGSMGGVVLQERAHDALADGFAGLLIDHPTAPPGVVVTAALEAELRLRPYWVGYGRQSILNWRTGEVQGRPGLTMVCLAETATLPAGDFGWQTVEQVRELRLVNGVAEWRIWRKNEQHVWEIAEAGIFRTRRGRPLDRLPFVIGYGGRKRGELAADIPLLGVAEANIDLWRLETNMRHLEERTCFPTPTVAGDLAPDPSTGLPPQTLSLSPSRLVHLTQGSTFGWAEVTGGSLDQLRASAREKKQAMAELGLSFLAGEKRASETAYAKRMDSNAERATLAAAGIKLTDWFNAALEIHAAYLEMPTAPTVTLNPSFEALLLDPAMVQAIGAAVKEGIIRRRTAVGVLQRGGLLPDDVDPEQEELDALADAAAWRDLAQPMSDPVRPGGTAPADGGAP